MTNDAAPARLDAGRTAPERDAAAPDDDDAASPEDTDPASAGAPASGSGGATGASGAGGAAGASTSSPGAVTFVATSTTAPVELSVDGMTCMAGRCAFETSGPRNFSAELTLMSATPNQMPVLARWSGCGAPKTTLFATWSGNDYIVTYTTQFSALSAPSTCSAEIVQGSWFTFAADLSLEVSTGAEHCAEFPTSPESLNQQCFAAPGTTLEVTSALPTWSCVSIGASGSSDELHMTSNLRLVAMPNQIVSCVAQRE